MSWQRMRSCAASRPVALLAIVRQEPHGDSREIGRDALPVLARAREGPEDIRDVVRRPGWELPMREELPEHDPDHVQSGPTVELLAMKLAM